MVRRLGWKLLASERGAMLDNVCASIRNANSAILSSSPNQRYYLKVVPFGQLRGGVLRAGDDLAVALDRDMLDADVQLLQQLRDGASAGRFERVAVYL